MLSSCADGKSQENSVSMDFSDELAHEYLSMLKDLEKDVPFFSMSIPNRSIFNVEMFLVFGNIIQVPSNIFHF